MDSRWLWLLVVLIICPCKKTTGRLLLVFSRMPSPSAVTSRKFRFDKRGQVDGFQVQDDPLSLGQEHLDECLDHVPSSPQRERVISGQLSIIHRSSRLSRIINIRNLASGETAAETAVTSLWAVGRPVRMSVARRLLPVGAPPGQHITAYAYVLVQ